MAYIGGNAKRVSVRYWMHVVGIMGVLGLLIAVASFPRGIAKASSSNWVTYMGNNERSGFNAAETVINPSSVQNLKLHWKLKAAGKVSTQPVAANGFVYWGSWDGLEHATNPATGTDAWTVNLGQSSSMCDQTVHGVLSTATVASVSIGGVTTPVVYVGGGNAHLYALNANTGSVIWHTPLGATPATFLYSDPAVYNGSVYLGVSSQSDCPLVQGQLVQLDASTGAIQHTFNVVPTGCLGGTVWVAPTIDTMTNILYFGTGNGGKCSTTENMAVALVALRTADLSFVSSWQVPTSQQSKDGDFGSTPTLFQATISGVLHQMVGLLNKNGLYYAFDRTTISAGPLWQVRLASPTANWKSNIASSAWDGTTLYAAAGSTTIKGAACAGSIRAVNPASGAFIWADCLSADVFGPVTAVSGLAEVGAGTSFMLVSTTTGKKLFSFQDTSMSSRFLGPGSISNGILYHGNTDGYLYAFGM